MVERLSLIINIMEDLLKLTHKHHTESKLHNGDVMKQIYMLLDIRIMQWLSGTCDKDLWGEKFWKKLIAFLEKKAKIQQ